MAVWQFVVQLIPATSAKVEGINAIRLDQNQLGSVQLQLSAEEADDLVASIGRLLPEGQPWASSLRVWGDEKADDAQVWFDEDRVDSVQIRFNVADLSLPLIEQFCTIARRSDCLFATPEGAIIQPRCDPMMRQLLQSDAARFVRDPAAFLAEASRIDRETS